MESKKILNKFSSQVNERIAMLEQEINLNMEILYSVKSLYDASENVTRDEFAVFAEQAVSRHQDIESLKWVPRISNNEREFYEAEARHDGYPDFQIKERGPDGKMIPAEQRPEYFPVYFIEPPTSENQALLGFDMISDPVRRKALYLSCDTGKICVSGPIKILNEKGSRKKIIAFLPVYQSNPEAGGKERNLLAGLVIGVFRIGDIFERVIQLTHSAGLGIDMTFLDESAPPDEQILHIHKSRTGKPAADIEPYRKEIRETGGRKWIILAVPTDSYIREQHTWYPFIVFIGSLLLTALWVSYLNLIARRTVHVENLVRERSRELRNSEAYNRTIVEMAVSGIITIDNYGTIETFNPAAEKIFGYKSEEVLGRNITMLMPEPYRSEHHMYIQNYIKTRNAKIIGIGREVIGKRKDNSTFPMELAVSEMNLQGQQKFVGLVTDITERKRANEALEKANKKLEKLSYMDGLTGIANRRHFEESLDKEWRRALRNSVPLSLIMLDIDYFKLFNDKYGHQGGDACLKKVAQSLNEITQRAGDVAARYGGEEFVILLPGINKDEARIMAEKYREQVIRLQIPHELSKACSVISISVGVSTISPKFDLPPRFLIETADKALYKAKHKGRNRVEIY